MGDHTQFRGRGRAPRLVARADHDGRARGGEAARDLLADSTGRAGDHRDFARHVHAADANDARLDNLCLKHWISCLKLQRLSLMDVLSDVLDTVRLSSTVFVRTEISPPW